jgi:hypothetical protein
MVTHDNRILDIADRSMLLEDGRLGSFGAVTSPHAGHLLTALACMTDLNHIQILLGRMNEEQFLELLRVMAAEFEQFLNTLDMGRRSSTQVLFRNLLEAVFGRIANLLAAEGAGMLTLRKWATADRDCRRQSERKPAGTGGPGSGPGRDCQPLRRRPGFRSAQHFVRAYPRPA